ncbi:MAG: extracellular solute-binding protein [Oscillospiraceae bacterium]|nr:extracellular solute-binding protein [Oscillospiraceae bacterium]
MKARHWIAVCALLAVVIFVGCDAGNTNSTSTVGTSGLPIDDPDESSDAPFDITTGTPMPDTPYLDYLGALDLESSEAAELYLKNYADGVSGKIISCEFVTSKNLASRLSERISADLSPDLCDRSDNSYPYLVSKNLYENLTTYIDIASPQWAEYYDYIISRETAGARYFYPTKVTVSPEVLIYNSTRFKQLGLEDPAELWKNGAWTRAKMSQMLVAAPKIGGANVLENFLASSGISLVSADVNGFAVRLNDDNFKKNALFVNENYTPVSDTGAAAILSGECAFLSVNDVTLAQIRREYSAEELRIVPFPVDEEAEGIVYNTLSEGFLVPKRAKNIKGAACFINCSRIAAENSEQTASQTDLLPADIEMLKALRSNADLSAVSIGSYCLDNASNASIQELIGEIYTSPTLSEDWEQLAHDYGPPLVRAITEINENLD